MSDEIQRLVLQVKGKEDVELLRKAIEQEEEALRKHVATLGNVSPAQASMDGSVRASAQTLQQLQKELIAAEKASGKLKNGMAGAGQAMLQGGRVIQDFAQGGLPGILNNIEGLTQAFGLGNGLAGVLTAVGVAAYLLGPKIKTLTENITFFGAKVGDAKSEVSGLEERIAELKKEPLKLAVDVHELAAAEDRLKELKKAQAAFDEAKEMKSSAQRESEKQIKDLLAEAPGGAEGIEGDLKRNQLNKLMPGVLAHHDQEVQDVDKQVAEERGRLRVAVAAMRVVSPAAADAAQAAGDAKLNAQSAQVRQNRQIAIQNAEKEAERNVGAAQSGAYTGDATQRERFLAMLRETGHGDLADKVAKITPEGIKKAKEDKKTRAKEDKEYDKENAAHYNEYAKREAQRKQKETQRKKEEKAKVTAREKAETAEAKPLIEAEEERIRSSGLIDQAAAMIAQRRKGGMSSDQAKDAVRAMLETELGKRKFFDPFGSSHVIAARANQAVENQLSSGADLGEAAENLKTNVAQRRLGRERRNRSVAEQAAVDERADFIQGQTGFARPEAEHAAQKSIDLQNRFPNLDPFAATQSAVAEVIKQNQELLGKLAGYAQNGRGLEREAKKTSERMRSPNVGGMWPVGY